MSSTLLARGRSRRLASGVAAAVALSLLAWGAAPADAVKPAGSRAVVMLETGTASGDPANALTSGWWGHEGGTGNGTGTGSTFLSMDFSDGNGTVDDASIAALLAAMDTDDPQKIFYAIVPTSSDGSNETPSVSAGENAAEAFDWVLYGNLGAALDGNTNANDSVATVSTQAQVEAWVAAGRPVQSYDNSLVLHDVNSPDNPVSPTPQGTSILNTWPAGTDLSLVAFVSDGMDADLDNQVPLVAVGPGGKAKTAWMPFTTVAKPGNALRTSAGYQVVGPYAPTVAVTHTFSGTTGTLTAAVKKKNGSAATDASGTVEFAPVVNGTRGSATAVAVGSDGKASLSVPGLSPGTLKTYDVRYVPDTDAQAAYLTTDWVRHTLISPTPTSTSLRVVGGAKDTLTATVSPTAASGRVTFKDGSRTLGSVNVGTGTSTAKLVKVLSAGKHTLQAVFAPSGSSYLGSSASKTIWQPRITTALKPKNVKKSTRPKLTVKVLAAGVKVTGKVVVVFDPPKGRTKRITVTLRAGSKVITLPKTVKGRTKLTVTYRGSAQVLAATKVFTFRAT